MLEWVKGSADWLAAVTAGLIAAGAVGRWMVRRVRRFAAKLESAREALVGREEIRHPDTGAVLVPATPSLGQRLVGIETGQRLIEENLTSLSNTRTEMGDLTRKVGELTDQLGTHITESNELELARTKERDAMWHAIEAVATPTPWDGTERRTREAGGSNG